MQGTAKMELIMCAVKQYADSPRMAADYNKCWDRIEALAAMNEEKCQQRRLAAFGLEDVRDDV